MSDCGNYIAEPVYVATVNMPKSNIYLESGSFVQVYWQKEIWQFLSYLTTVAANLCKAKSLINYGTLSLAEN